MKATKLNPMSFWAVFAFASLAFIPEIAMAAPWDSAASSVLKIFNSGLTRSIAIIAVIALGISALTGRLEIQRAVWVIAGIVIIFGAAAIVDYVIAAAA